MKVVIASGRTSFAIEPQILGGIKPDYMICANGAQILDGQGRLLYSQDLTAEEMYALVDFFEDFDYPLAFNFADNYYVYVEYKAMWEFYKKATGHGEYVLDGEDQDRHLESMPFGAFAILPPEQVEKFQEKYGYLGLKFVPYRPGYYDVMQADVDNGPGHAAPDGAHRLDGRGAGVHGRQRKRHCHDAAGGLLLLYGERLGKGQGRREAHRPQCTGRGRAAGGGAAVFAVRGNFHEL